MDLMPLIYKKKYFLIISAFLQYASKPGSPKRTKFTDLFANHNISFAWQNNLVIDLLSKKKEF